VWDAKVIGRCPTWLCNSSVGLRAGASVVEGVHAPQGGCDVALAALRERESRCRCTNIINP
jgi:hypothetical protein